MPRAFLLCLVLTLTGCAPASQQQLASVRESAPSTITEPALPKNSVPVIHVFVALCDNVNQGIVPVRESWKRRQSGNESLLGRSVRD